MQATSTHTALAQIQPSLNLADFGQLRRDFAPRIDTVQRPNPVLSPFLVDKLEVQVFSTAEEAGHAAAFDDLAYLNALNSQTNVYPSVLVARAKSQRTRWYPQAGGLSNPEGLGKIFPAEKLRVCFMDEFWAQDIAHPGSLSSEFRAQVPGSFLSRLKGQELNPLASSIEEELARYGKIIRKCMPFNLATTGIGTGRQDGTGAHKAFMDAPWASADLKDPRVIMAVPLPDWCRKQQMQDFGPTVYPNIESVPAYALSVTMAVILGSQRVSCLVIGDYKSAAVKVVLTCNPDADNPAALMRQHSCATLYLDSAAAKQALAALH